MVKLDVIVIYVIVIIDRPVRGRFGCVIDIRIIVPALSKGTKGIMELSLFVCSFIRPFVHLDKMLHCNSATTGPIHSKSSLLEQSWPVDVQHHAHLRVRLLEPCSQGGGPSSDLLVLTSAIITSAFVIFI